MNYLEMFLLEIGESEISDDEKKKHIKSAISLGKTGASAGAVPGGILGYKYAHNKMLGKLRRCETLPSIREISECKKKILDKERSSKLKSAAAGATIGSLIGGGFGAKAGYEKSKKIVKAKKFADELMSDLDK